MVTKANIKEFLSGIVFSYSQVFFSTNRMFGIILLVVSFVDANAGLAGFTAVLLINLLALGLGFNRMEIKNGLFGFNALLVGLGIGYFFKPSVEMYLIVFVGAVLTLLLTTLSKGILQKYGLPYLSIPFLFAIWTILASSSYFEALGISHKGIFTLNKLYGIGGLKLVSLYESISDIPLNESLKTYFRSLGAIFFQFNILAGVLIAFGLLLYSRIAFLLSLYGFYAAMIFYNLLGGNFAELNYSNVGFNYILTSIAIGGFFLIPSRKTFLWLLALIPVVTLTTLSLSKVLIVFHLSIYSLPFNIVVLLFIYSLKFRIFPSPDLREVLFQQNNPEENLYAWHNQKTNYQHGLLVPFRLPFHGAWTVSQGYRGPHTHKDEWQHAWDFVMYGDDGEQFENKGDYPEDYHCFGKSVLAAAPGVVEEIITDIKDNDIGKVNTWQNWGNSVVIKHADYLYSSYSHLRSETVIVKPGDKIKAGQKIGEAGNSGRSPFPHLHFQFQGNPYIGSKTMEYPFSYFLQHRKSELRLSVFQIPGEDEVIENIETSSLLSGALHFIPGRVLNVKFIFKGQTRNSSWEVFTTSYNQSYLFEKSTNSFAWFVNDNSMIYFTQYKGKRTSSLYYFYMAFYKIPLTFHDGLSIDDELPLNRMFSFPILFLQDFFAPFFLFLKSAYRSKLISSDPPVNPAKLIFKNTITRKIFGYEFSEMNFQTEVTSEKISIKKEDNENEIFIQIPLH